jgi:hypothetical protein
MLVDNNKHTQFWNEFTPNCSKEILFAVVYAPQIHICYCDNEASVLNAITSGKIWRNVAIAFLDTSAQFIFALISRHCITIMLFTKNAYIWHLGHQKERCEETR